MNTEQESKFYELSEDTMNTFVNIFNDKNHVNLRFQFIGSVKQKELIKISKINDQYAFLLDKELLVSINEDILNVMDEESINILIEQEIDKVSVNIDNGNIKMVKPDLTTFSGIIRKYGVDKVARANKVEELYVSQKTDAVADEQFLV